MLTFFAHMSRADVLDMTVPERRWHVARVERAWAMISKARGGQPGFGPGLI